MKDDKAAFAREKLRKAIASKSSRAIETSLNELQDVYGEKKVSETDLQLMQLASLQSEELVSLNSSSINFTKFLS